MDNNYSGEYETNEEKKFTITRGMVILAALILIIIIIIIIIIVNSINSKKPKYTIADFNKLEYRMEEEAMTYLSQNNIELGGQEVKIDLKSLLLENGGAIDSSKVKAAKICDGYVLASKIETEKYKAYIKCKDLYTTSGYVSNNKKVTTSKTTTKKDTEKPVITIIGEKEVTINQGSNYIDKGVKVTDNVDGDITSKVQIENKVDTSKPGSYTITYIVSDKAGNRAEALRKVIVVTAPTTKTSVVTTKKSSSSKPSNTTRPKITQTQRINTAPTITLNGSLYITINVGTRYIDPGYSAKDALGRDLTANVNVSGSVNTNVAGTYTIRYSVTDSYGNSSSKTRTIKVNSNYISLKSITLTPNTVILNVGKTQVMQVYFNPTNATNKSVSWSSSNPAVATVSGGVVSAKSKGTIIITVTGADGQKASASVTVK